MSNEFSSVLARAVGTLVVAGLLRVRPGTRGRGAPVDSGSVQQESATPVPQLPQLDVVGASSGAAVVRLRRRARWVNSLQESLGLDRGVLGALLAGRWTPDLPGDEAHVCSKFGSLLANGARVLGAGWCEPEPGAPLGDGVEGGCSFVRMGFPHEVEVLAVPELVGDLWACAAFRVRDGALVSSLAWRAKRWLEGRGLTGLDVSSLLFGSVAVACCLTSAEEGARRLLATPAVSGTSPIAPYVPRKVWAPAAH